MNPITKLLTLRDLPTVINFYRKDGRCIVFTNGCFDLLHVGHVRYLQAARSLGDFLIVGLNSDASVRAIKGDKRPLVPEADRAEVLSALACVDLVVLFDDPTPYELIAIVKPNILVKGGDWAVDQIIGREIVEKAGGKVCTLPVVEGASTTDIIRRVLERYSRQP